MQPGDVLITYADVSDRKRPQGSDPIQVLKMAWINL